MKYVSLSSLVVSISLLTCSSFAWSADTLKSAIDTRIGGQKESISSQARIDKIADQTTDLLTQYRSVLQQSESLHIYNEQLQKLVDKQADELLSFERQFSSIQVTQRRIVPFMLRMIEVLDDFIKLDTPFLSRERNARIEILKAMMDDPESSLPEKYRRIMEAYQIELEYGRTIEAYSATLKKDDQPRTVDFLRIGRVGLFYMTFDGVETGYWDKKTAGWQQLPEEYQSSIRQGIQIARKEVPPDLIRLPVPAPTEGGQ